jgi:hypothetical protein
LASLPGESLGHVSGAAGVYSTFFRVWTGEGDSVARASDLEGAGRLQVLQFQKDICWCIVNVQADEGSSQNCALDPFSGLLDKSQGYRTGDL